MKTIHQPGQRKRIVNITKNFTDAEKWDIEQQINMTPDQRFAAAKELRERFYGKNQPGVREWYQKN